MSENRRVTIKAKITLEGVEITLDVPEGQKVPETEGEGQALVDQLGLGFTDFDLDLAEEEVEVYDAYPAGGE